MINFSFWSNRGGIISAFFFLIRALPCFCTAHMNLHFLVLFRACLTIQYDQSLWWKTIGLRAMYLSYFHLVWFAAELPSVWDRMYCRMQFRQKLEFPLAQCSGTFQLGSLLTSIEGKNTCWRACCYCCYLALAIFCRFIAALEVALGTSIRLASICELPRACADTLRSVGVCAWFLIFLFR